MRNGLSGMWWTAAAVSVTLGALALGFSSAQAPGGTAPGGAAAGGPPPMPPMPPLKGDVAAGEKVVAQICARCHGAKGDSTRFPRLAAQVPSYTTVQLYNFKGPRQNPIMTPIARSLTDQNIADVAAYYAAQRPAGPIAATDAKAVEAGRALYFQGRAKDGLIACSVCHGQAGQGVNELEVARIAHQTPEYLVDVLNEFKKGPDAPVATYTAMKIVANKLSDADIAALAQYLASSK